MAPRLPESLKTALREKGWSDQELTPFSESEQRSIEAQVSGSEQRSIVVRLRLGLKGTAIDFSNTWFDAGFFARGFVFSRVDFRGATFSDTADFARATFSGGANFYRTTFGRKADFDHVTFRSWANFWRAIFNEDAHFGGTTFGRKAGFDDVTFHHFTAFGSATFSSEVSFRDTTFILPASFRHAIFSSVAFFARATFNHDAHFTSTTFSGLTDFRSATFRRDANFVNAELKNPTTFDEVKFAEPPQCFNTKLHEGTTWHGVHWPEAPRDVERARRFIDSYERLKLEMDKLKRHEDELNFFALELQCRQVVDGFWRGLPIAIYGGLSDYGRSYTRPLVLIAAVVLVGAFPAAYHLVGFWAPMPGRAFGLSFANTFSVLGIRREFTDPDTIKLFPAWLTVMATVQSILGVVLLFLFGLGIRNRFRIK